MALKELVGTRLREARRLKGWTQAQAAESIHVKQSTWAAWEIGQNSIPLEFLEYAARELEQPIEFFVVANYEYYDATSDYIGKKIEAAAKRYAEKFGVKPDTAFVNPADFKVEKVGSIVVKPKATIMPNHIWLGLGQG